MTEKKYDLEDRTSRFGEEVIKLAKRVPETAVTKSIISQLVRAGTSVGANYCEANNAESRKDFKHKIALCKKEAKETKHWLKMLVVAIPELKEEVGKLWQEAKELTLIFNAIFNSTEKKIATE